MQLAEMRASKQMGEDEPELRRDLMTAKDSFDAKMVETQTELERLWAAWDAGVDTDDEAARAAAKDAMVGLAEQAELLAQSGPRTCTRHSACRLADADR